MPFFAGRAVFYFAVWSAARLAAELAGRAQQDAAPDPAPRRAPARRSRRSGLVLLSLTTTFAAVDWGMSLAPALVLDHLRRPLHRGLDALAPSSFTIVLLARLAGEAPFDDGARSPVTVHDLGKLLLAFTMLWAYVNFSQFLIVWSGNISEETPFYLHRLQGGWQVVAIALLVFHFALPFALLLSRPLKRNARALGDGGGADAR